ncbi:unnamed protein product, partial [marine sediment metagenome]
WRDRAVAPTTGEKVGDKIPANLRVSYAGFDAVVWTALVHAPDEGSIIHGPFSIKVPFVDMSPHARLCPDTLVASMIGRFDGHSGRRLGHDDPHHEIVEAVLLVYGPTDEIFWDEPYE